MKQPSWSGVLYKHHFDSDQVVNSPLVSAVMSETLMEKYSTVNNSASESGPMTVRSHPRVRRKPSTGYCRRLHPQASRPPLLTKIV
jgi:hypothetical protein